MSFKRFIEVPLGNRKPLLAGSSGNAFYKSHRIFREEVKKRLGKQASDLFAIPGFESLENIASLTTVWYVEFDFIGQPKAYSEATKIEIIALVDALTALRSFVNSDANRSNPADLDFSSRLNQALIFNPENSVFFVEGKPVIIFWGFSDFNNITYSSEITFNIIQEKAQKPFESLVTESEIEQLYGQKEGAEDPSKEDNIKVESARQVNESDNTDGVKRGKDSDIIQNPENFDDKKERSDGFFEKFRKGLPLNKILKISLAIIIFLTLLLLIFKFTKNIESETKSNLLPENAGVPVPIDSSKVILGPDSVYIVSNRLSLLFEDDSVDVIEFAKEFKRAFLGKDFRIIYYDTSLVTLMTIEVPDDSLFLVKNTINKRIPNFRFTCAAELVIKSSYMPNDMNIKNIGVKRPLDLIKAFDAWDITQGSNNIVIAIIDDGIDLQHSEFQNRIFKPWSVYNRSSQLINTSKVNNHGTHVTGIAAAAIDNGFGISGIAPKSRIMPVQIFDYNGNSSYSAILEGIKYALNNGAEVINLSLHVLFPPYIKLYSETFQRDYARNQLINEEKIFTSIFKKAYDKDIAIVFAAGNDNSLIEVDPAKRSPYVINVSAVDQMANKSNFSNYGNSSTISAPGVAIISSVPGNRFKQMDGTSMAAPFVSGAIALIKSVNPALTVKQIVNIIQTTGIRIAGSRKIGPLIQLSDMLNAAKANRFQQPQLNCGNYQAEADKLLRRLNFILDKCRGQINIDTLKLPMINQNMKALSGTWKSTSNLFITGQGRPDPVEIFFEFQNPPNGTIYYVSSQSTFTSPIRVQLKGGSLDFEQLNQAIPTRYGLLPITKYSFNCVTDINGNANCSANNLVSRQAVLRFNLVKVR